jgi:hypothetical protein
VPVTYWPITSVPQFGSRPLLEFRGLWSSGEQKSDKIRAPQGIMTKSDWALAQPGPIADRSVCSVMPQLAKADHPQPTVGELTEAWLE